MPYKPKTLGAVAVPEFFWHELQFAWPGSGDPFNVAISRTNPLSIGNPGQLGLSSSVSPLSFTDFTLAVTMVPSMQPAAANAMIAFSTLENNGGSTLVSGIAIGVKSGFITFRMAADDGTFNESIASASTIAGAVVKAVVVFHYTNSRYHAIFNNGTLAFSSAAISSWSMQNTAVIGLSYRASPVEVFSGNVRDLYIFRRALTEGEIKRLARGLA